MPEQDALPPGPWSIDPLGWDDGQQDVLDADGKTIVSRCRSGVAALLLRAPALEQAARDAETLIAGHFGESAPQVVQAVLERLRVALGESK